METRSVYLAFVGLVVLERAFELWLTQRNLRRLEERGGVLVGEGHYPWMVLLHTALLIAAPLEVFVKERPFVMPLGVAATLLVAGSMSLRYWAILSLGDRWTTRVVVVPGEAPVVRGPYRFVRHPNYLAVVAEVAALPLVHTAWWSAVAFSVLNAFVLRERIRVEEQALAEASEYQESLGEKPRFLPKSLPSPRGSEGGHL